MSLENRLPEIDWDPDPILRPGVDFQDGTVYFTVPLMRTVLRPPKKKDADPVIVKEMQTYVVTSDREGFWYDEHDLHEHGFSSHSQVLQETESRWARPSVRAYLEGEASGPATIDLFNELRNVYTTYVEFADEAYYDIMPLYIMSSYLFRLYESTGYIHFNGTAASGKSRNLSILDTLAFNTIWASSMSAAALYRKLAGSPGTTCIDESEGFEGERGEELRRILNAGYKDGSHVFRAEKGPGDRFQTVAYEVYGPKALASINPLDNVIGSRCLIIAMRPAVRELPDFLTNDPRWLDLRNKLYLWALENTEAVSSVIKEWQGGKKHSRAPRLIGRQWETTQQYICLAEYVGGEGMADRLIEFFNGYFAKQQEALDATDRLRTTLRCLPRVLATKMAHPGGFYSTKDIHEVISSYMETDATEYFKTRHVTKNLDVLGFRTKKRAAGGVQILIDEQQVRNEFRQRRVEPFEEDRNWLDGTTDYQHQQPETPQPKLKLDTPWWDTEDQEPSIEELTA